MSVGIYVMFASVACGSMALGHAACYQQGWTPEEIADQYPHITFAQVYAAPAYYHANRDEIERELEAESADFLRLQDEFANPTE